MCFPDLTSFYQKGHLGVYQFKWLGHTSRLHVYTSHLGLKATLQHWPNFSMALLHWPCLICDRSDCIKQAKLPNHSKLNIDSR